MGIVFGTSEVHSDISVKISDGKTYCYVMYINQEGRQRELILKLEEGGLREIGTILIS